MSGLGFGESRTIRRETAAEVVEEQAREYAERADVSEEVAEHVVILAGVMADCIRSHVPELGDEEDTAPCPECGNLSLLLMGRRRRRVLLDLDRERQKQHAKWGEQRHTPFGWLAIIGEELGEANRSALHDRFGGEAAGTLRTELVQLAAVVVQVLELIDADELNAPARGGIEGARPRWDDGIPWCCERCPSHDGKRCELLGHATPQVCLPTVKALA